MEKVRAQCLKKVRWIQFETSSLDLRTRRSILGSRPGGFRKLFCLRVLGLKSWEGLLHWKQQCVNSTLLPLEVGLCIHSLASGAHHSFIYHAPKPCFLLKSEPMKSENQQRVTASTHTLSQAVLLTLLPQYPRKIGLWALGNHDLRAPQETECITRPL